MRRVFLLAGISLVLVGCAASAQAGTLGPSDPSSAAEKAKRLGLLTPAIVRECSAHVVKMFTKPPKIVGPFVITTLAALRRASHHRSMFPEPDDAFAVIAPVNSIGLFGLEYKNVSGCTYRLKDNRLVFEKANLIISRIDRVRVAPTQVQPKESR